MLSLDEYKELVTGMGLNSSDRKKLLALPFYLTKRMQLPEPRRGQSEFDFFKELTGHDWYDDQHYLFDPENKITEFDYENYIDPLILKTIDTSSPEFKKEIKKLNLLSKTKLEKLEE